MVTHPSTNRARRRLTSLIRPTFLTVLPRRQPSKLRHQAMHSRRVCGLAVSADGYSDDTELAMNIAVY